MHAFLLHQSSIKWITQFLFKFHFEQYRETTCLFQAKPLLMQSPTSSSGERGTISYIFLSCAVEKNPPCRSCHSWSFPSTKLVNWHAGSGRFAFVLTRTDSPPLLITEIKEITRLLLASPTPYTRGTASQEHRGQCTGLRKLLESSSGLVDKYKTSLTHQRAICQSTFPALILYMQDKILLLVPFYLH